MGVNQRFYKSDDYQYLRHESCEVCGSKNNVGVWLHKPTNKETKHCFTEGCTNNVHTKDLYNTSQPGAPLPKEWLDVLRISPQTAAKYRLSHEGKVLYFGYSSTEGRLQRVKKRDYSIPKSHDYHFSWLTKEGETTLLFGMDTCTNPERSIIITEGELDAPCAYEMTGMNAVSIPNGTQGADNAIRDNFLWLKQFKKVYICFDNDSAGQSAAKRVQDIIGFRARIVSLPQYTIALEDERIQLKDARDFRKYSFDTEFKDALVAADKNIQPFVWSRDEVRAKLAEAYQSGFTKTYSTGLKDLDLLCPIRMGELTITFGSPGRGKSSLGRYIAKELIEQGVRPYYMSFEEGVANVIYKLSALLLGKPVYYNADGTISNPLAEVLDNGDSVLDKVDIAKLDSIEPDDIYDAIECAYITHGCQFVLLDHITWLLDSAGNPVQTARAILHKLCELVSKYPIHIFAISHNQPSAKPQQRDNKVVAKDWEEYLEPTQRDAQWSSGMEQLAYNIWGLKNPDNPAEPMRIYVLKNRHGGKKKCGKVIAYYQEDGTFLGANDAKKMHRNTRNPYTGGHSDKVRFDGGETSPGEVLSPHQEIPQNLYSVPTEEGTLGEHHRATEDISGDEGEGSPSAHDPGDNRTTEEIQQDGVQSRLLRPGNRVDYRGKRRDARRVPNPGGNTEEATPNILPEVQIGIPESKASRSKKKADIRGLGD